MSETTTTPKTEWACTNCGSTDVGNDAFVNPNTHEVVGIYDAAHCFSCDQDTTLVERPSGAD